MMIPGRPLHNETQRHVARMSAPDATHIGDLDYLVRSLIDAGVWDRLTILCVAGTDEADSLLDLKGNQDSVKIGSPVFTADQGFTTVGFTDVIDTQLTLGAGYYGDASLAVYIQLSHVAWVLMGELPDSGPGSAVYAASSTTFKSSIQGPDELPMGVSGGGMRQGSRISLAEQSATAEGGYVMQNSLVDPWRPLRSSIIVGASGRYGLPPFLPSPNTYSLWSAGFGLTATQSLAYDSIMQEYFTRRGTAV